MKHDRVAAALAEQLTYYRRTAADFDRYAHVALLDELGGRLLGLVDLSGNVLEIACGVGQWTARLAEIARHLTAIDAGCGCYATECLVKWRPRGPFRLSGRATTD